MAVPVERVVVVGSKELARRVVELLTEIDAERLVGIVTIDDRSDTRSRLEELTALAERRGLDLVIAETRQEAEAAIVSMAPDLGIVVGWYWLLSDALLSAASAGFAGIHYSLLPKYRGSSPLVWALLRGEEEVGLSLFKLGSGVDDGPLWGQRSIRVQEEYVGAVAARLDDEAIELLRDAYPGMLDGSRVPVVQPDDRPTFAAPRSPMDGRIDWRQSAITIARAVRAQSAPYPGAWTLMNDERLTIWRARADTATWFSSPGQVLAKDGQAVLVGCGDETALRVEEVALNGGAAQPAVSVIRPGRLRLGP